MAGPALQRGAGTAEEAGKPMARFFDFSIRNCVLRGTVQCFRFAFPPTPRAFPSLVKM